LYKLNFHFINEVKKSVACKGDECHYCQAGEQKRTEYNYWVNLNEQDGLLNVKPSVFFAIQQISRASKKDFRQISWLVIKSGQGLDTEYTVSKDETLTADEYKKIKIELDKNTNTLTKLMEVRENKLLESYDEYMGEVSKKPKKGNEDINPDDIQI